jgi:hypothetical protein
MLGLTMPQTLLVRKLLRCKRNWPTTAAVGQFPPPCPALVCLLSPGADIGAGPADGDGLTNRRSPPTTDHARKSAYTARKSIIPPKSKRPHGPAVEWVLGARAFKRRRGWLVVAASARPAGQPSRPLPPGRIAARHPFLGGEGGNPMSTSGTTRERSELAAPINIAVQHPTIAGPDPQAAAVANAKELVRAYAERDAKLELLFAHYHLPRTGNDAADCRDLALRRRPSGFAST